MPEYTVASVAVLAAAFVVAAARGMLGRRSAWLGLLAFGIATIAADLVLTGIGVFTYPMAPRTGIAIGRMPVEDLLYGLAVYLVAIAAWGPPPVAGTRQARTARLTTATEARR